MKRDDGWMQGIAYALAEVNRLRDAPTTIGEILRANNYTLDSFRAAGVDEFDLRQLRKAFRAVPAKPRKRKAKK